MMVSKKKVTDEEADEMMEEKTNHSDHVRSKNYDKDCYWCVNLGFINPESPDSPSD